MRFSSYNIGTLLKDQNYYLLLHGYTGAVDKVEADFGKYFIDYRGEDCQEFLNGASSDFILYLQKRGYITTLSHNEEQKLLIKISTEIHKNDVENSVPGFMFIPSYKCNLRCPYCFQPHEMHRGEGKYSKILTKEQVDDVFKIIDKYNYGGSIYKSVIEGKSLEFENLNTKNLKIGLFGGEPLTNETKDVVEYIVKLTHDRGGSVMAITNGVELDVYENILKPNYLDELQITLDGTNSFHDKRRVGPEFKKTFQIISNNIDLALRNNVIVNLRMNIDSTNIAEIESITDYSIAKKWTDYPNFKANAAVVTPEGKHKELVTKTQLIDETIRLSTTKKSPFFSYENVAKEILEIALIDNKYPYFTSVNCSSETGLLMFDSMGDVYSCWEELGEIDKRIGTYNSNGINFNKHIAEKWLNRFPGTIEQCSNCPYALIHTSGCAKHAEKLEGSIYNSACESFQEYFPITLASAYSHIEDEILNCV